MNMDAMAALFSEVLATQVESGEYGALPQARLLEMLTTGPPPTPEEQAVLILSPVAREDYRLIRQQVNDSVRARLKELAIEQELFAMAADSDEDTLVMRGNGFTVTLYRRNDLGIPWVILVQLGPAYMEAINPMTTLRLVDSGGLEWCRGKPDGQGEVSAFWSDPETDILARSKRFSLVLEPV